MKRLISLATLAFALTLTTTVGALDLPSGERASLARAADADLASQRAGTAGGAAMAASEREALGRAVEASPGLDELSNDDHDLLIIAIVVGVVILIIVL